MNPIKLFALLTILFSFFSCKKNEPVSLQGELMVWHKVTLVITGPETHEQAIPNPFLDYRLQVEFSNGDTRYIVPGYFAADGNAAESSASEGKIWKVHFSPDKPGKWNYTINFRTGKNIAMSDDPEEGATILSEGHSGSFDVKESDKEGKDFRAKGRLSYVGENYLQHKGTGDYFLKGGADSPENFLGYMDFDGTFYGGKNEIRTGEDTPNLGLHSYEPHIRDWQEGDPVWQGSKGKGIIGALNYLASKEMNSVYFLTMNILGDGDDVWPYTDRNERYRFDCSKLDQWEMVFSHMDKLGIMLHVVLQETENECVLDAGYLDVQRKLYLRELVARFSHHQAITWNLGEEHHPASWSPYGQTVDDTKKMASYLRNIDPYDHMIVVHTHADDHSRNYYISQYLGFDDLNGPSIQVGNPFDSHGQTLKWVNLAASSGHNWVVCIDEIGQHWKGAMPDEADPDHDTIRQNVLWANLMAGGAGVEWYFGYQYPHGDLNCEDWRSRDNLWGQTRVALEFFHKWLPFSEMMNRDDLVENAYCFAKNSDLYAIYFPESSRPGINLSGVKEIFNVSWSNPLEGGDLMQGSISEVTGGSKISLGLPPHNYNKDWVCLLQKKEEGFVSLFNGKDLTNWLVQAVPSDADKKYWYVEDGTIVANSMGDSTHDYIWLQSQKEYNDFHLKLKFQAFRDNPGNSGVQIRSRYDEEASWLDGPQIDINPPENWRTGLMWDETRGNKRWIYPDLPDTLWVNSSMVSQPAPFYYAGDEKEWNEMEIIANQNHVEAFLNGQKITDFYGEGILDDALHKKFNVGQKGHICLQIHIRDQLKIKYKDIYIKEI